MVKTARPTEHDDNPEWTEADFARARPAGEIIGEEAARLLVRKRSPRGGYNAAS